MKPSATAVLEMLRERGAEGLTDGEAHQALHQTRLAARVADLKAEGVEVRSELVQVETAAGTARVARYFLGPEPFRAGRPIGRVRECPSCHDMHAVGTTCDLNRAEALTGAVVPPAAPVSAAAAAGA